MPTDLRFVIPNQPGRCARVLEALAAEGINLQGVSGDLRPGETWGFIHVLVDDADKATRILESAGIEITSRHKVEVHELEDRPGAIAEVLRTYADADDNVEVVYTLSDNRIVVGSESMRNPMTGIRTQDARNPWV